MASIKRKGFTLVELLIVIVVIGILSAMMMLSSTEAVSSARASKVISNMRNLKTAVLGWYTDNINRVVNYKVKTDGKEDVFNDFVGKHSDEILKYLNNDSSITFKNKANTNNNTGADTYTLLEVTKSDGKKYWYVYYHTGTDTKLREKLASKANGVGLQGLDAKENEKNMSDYVNQKYVCMEVLCLDD